MLSARLGNACLHGGHRGHEATQVRPVSVDAGAAQQHPHLAQDLAQLLQLPLIDDEEVGILQACLEGLGAVGVGLALRPRVRFRQYLAGGMTIVIALQALIILGGVLRLLPITGLTLPFLSYGGSSLIANLTIVALLLRISHEERL